jgi:SAM-dependent methyltransferase
MALIDTEIVICSNCGSDQAETIETCKDFNYKSCDNFFEFVSCNRCHQIYLKNRPLVKYLPLIYPEQKYVAYSNRDQGFLSKIKEIFIKKKIAPLLENCSSNALIMEVGCASGELMKLIKRFGNQSWSLFAIDISDKYFKDLESLGVKTIKSRFEDLNDFDCRFSALIMNQVIEHLESPKDVIKKSYELLMSNGILILETPSIEGIDKKIFKDKWEGWHAPRHWHMFDEQRLKDILRDNGFTPIKVEYIFSPYIWIYSIRNFLEAKNFPSIFLQTLNLNNFFVLSFVCVIDYFQKTFFRKTSNMRIIARKN